MTRRFFGSAICVFIFAITCGRQARTQTQPSARALVEAYVSAWNKRDFITLDGLLAPDALHEDMARPSRDEGPSQINQSIRTTIESQPDLNWHLNSIVDGGSVVAVEWVWSGTFIGDSPVSPRMPRRISGRGASVFVIENGRIKRVSDYYDFESVFH